MPAKMKRLLEQLKGKTPEEVEREILREIENVRMQEMTCGRHGGLARVASQPNFSLHAADVGGLARMPSLNPSAIGA